MMIDHIWTMRRAESKTSNPERLLLLGNFKQRAKLRLKSIEPRAGNGRAGNGVPAIGAENCFALHRAIGGFAANLDDARFRRRVGILGRGGWGLRGRGLLLRAPNEQGHEGDS